MQRNRNHNIQQANVRAKLEPRREPYWQSVAERGHLGFRKMPGSGTETWSARYRDESCKAHYKSLGHCSALSFQDARKAANEWFQQCGLGVITTCTVAEACKAYVENRKSEKSEQCGHRANVLFKAHIYDNKLGRIKLDKLRAAHIEKWRNELVTPKRSKRAANRILKTVKAALNYAYKHQMTSTDHPWRVVSRFPEKDRQREVYLEADHCRALLDACPAELADFVTGLMHTAARSGELAEAKVMDLDLNANTLTLRTQKGNGGVRSRAVPLSRSAVLHFKAMHKDKLPGAFLYTIGGKQWRNYEWAVGIKEAVNKAGLDPRIVAYTLRHTTISNWIRAGINVAAVAKMAGTSIKQINDHYFKFVQTDVQDKLDAVNVI